MVGKIIIVALWYGGALIILWRVTLGLMQGVSWRSFVFSLCVFVLMLMHAASANYEYVGTPVESVFSSLWILATFIPLVSTMRSLF